MKKMAFISLFVVIFALVPALLAWHEGVPVRSAYQGSILFLSLAAFGLMLGQFWLSGLLPPGVAELKRADVLGWHKPLGYTVGAVMLLHPVAMIARRFWVQESDPWGNLVLLLEAPALRPAVAAWILLVVIVVLSLARRLFSGRAWRTIHGWLSAVFVALGAWHVVAVGRHSDAALSAFWIVLAVGAVAALARSYLPSRRTRPIAVEKGAAHEPA